MRISLLLSARQPCESVSLEPRAMRRASRTVHAKVTAQTWTTDMYSRTDGREGQRATNAVKSFRSGGLRAQYAATRDRSFLYRPHTVGTARVKLQSIDWGQCTSTSVQEQVNWCSPKHAPVLGWSPLSRRLRTHDLCISELICACTILLALRSAHNRRKERTHGTLPR